MLCSMDVSSEPPNGHFNVKCYFYDFVECFHPRPIAAYPRDGYSSSSTVYVSAATYTTYGDIPGATFMEQN